jgi:formylglycine-generating enzyme required for sulfatase activity
MRSKMIRFLMALALVVPTSLPVSAENDMGETKQTFRDCADCPVMVIVPAGTFTMGSPSNPSQFKNEQPPHTVTISRQFAIGQYEVTRGQFRKFVTQTAHQAARDCLRGSGQGPGSWEEPGFLQDDSHPVVCVSPPDQRAYLSWLTKVAGAQYRLPTEAEWEYAARAGSTTRYFFGDDALDMILYGNGADLATHRKYGFTTYFNYDDGFAETAPAGSFMPNNWGLYDVSGNAFEVVADCYQGDYVGAPTDGSAWVWPDCRRYSVRSGGWSHVSPLRSAGRLWGTYDHSTSTTGFRVVRQMN